MTTHAPSFFIGKYFVPYPLVRSIYAIPGTPFARYELRDWAFQVTEITENGFRASNTTTGHYLHVSMEEILACHGDDGLPPNYFRPLTLQLDSQICWNATMLWKEPIARRPRVSRRRALN